jgi:DNA repair protein RadC
LACKDTLTQQHFDTPESVYNAFGPEMRALDREVLAVVLLNTRFRLIKFEKLSQGTVNETLAHPRGILKPAIIHSACWRIHQSAQFWRIGWVGHCAAGRSWIASGHYF